MAEKDIINISVEVLDKGLITILDVQGSDDDIIKVAGENIDNLFTKNISDPFKTATITLGIKLPLFLLQRFNREYNYCNISPKYTADVYEPSEERLASVSERNKGIFRNLTSSIGSVTDQAIRMDEKAGIDEGITQVHRLVSNYIEIVLQVNALQLMNLFDKYLKPQGDSTAVEMIQYIEVLATLLERWMPATFTAYCKHRLNSITFNAWEIYEISKQLDYENIAHDLKQAVKPEHFDEVEWKIFLDKIESINELKNYTKDVVE